MTLNQLISMSVNHNTESEEYETSDVILMIDGNKVEPYAVSIAYRELLFYCDDFTVNYVIDSYGDKHYASIFEITKD